MFIISILLHYYYILGAIYKYIATIVLVLKISSMGSYLLTRPRALEIIEPPWFYVKLLMIWFATGYIGLGFIWLSFGLVGMD